MKRPVNILFFAATSRYSGAEIVLERILKHLSNDERFRIHLLSGSKTLLRKTYTHCQAQNFFQTKGNLNWRSNPFNFFRLFGTAIQLRKHLISFLQTNSIDIIHANSLDSAFYSALLPKRLRLKLLWHHHNIFKKRGVEATVSRFLLPRFHRVVPVSHAAAEIFPGNLNKISVIHNGIDTTNRFNSICVAPGKLRKAIGCSSKTRLLGVVGQIHPSKGTHVAVEIFRQLMKCRPAANYRLVIVGSHHSAPQYYEDLRRQIHEHSLDSLVSLTGPWEQIEEVYRDLDCLILPSIAHEALPTVILEAFSMGILVAGTPMGGTKEIIQNESNGLLFDQNAPDQFAERLSVLLENPKRMQEMQARARLTACQNFDLSRQISELTRIYLTDL